jgi:hypothetical protein
MKSKFLSDIYLIVTILIFSNFNLFAAETDSPRDLEILLNR